LTSRSQLVRQVLSRSLAELVKYMTYLRVVRPKVLDNAIALAMGRNVPDHSARKVAMNVLHRMREKLVFRGPLVDRVILATYNEVKRFEPGRCPFCGLPAEQLKKNHFAQHMREISEIVMNVARNLGLA